MSLKAKIEAVIYASEEPVTLAQLVGLLGVEGQGELDRLADRQERLRLEGPDAGEPELVESGANGLAAAADSEPGLVEDPPPAMPGSVERVGEFFEPGRELVEPVRESSEPVRQSTDGLPAVGEAVGQPMLVEDSRERRLGRERRLREFFRGLLEELMRDYATSDRGLEVREVAGGFRMATKPEYHDAVRGFVRSLKPPLKLSLQALETLAVVAYKQPVTAPEVSEIRGVDSGGVLGSLMARKLVATAGRKPVVGRPILYKTTKDFLLRFGLKDTSELPSIEEFEKMAGEMAGQEEMEMPSDPERRMVQKNLEREKGASEPQADGDSNALEDDSNLAEDDLPAVDGRMSGVPPSYDRPGDDPSADEAAIQEQEGGA